MVMDDVRLHARRLPGPAQVDARQPVLAFEVGMRLVA